MSGHPKHLPADERRAAAVEAVVDLAREQNPGDITTAAIAQSMGLTRGALFRHSVDKAAEGGASPIAALGAMFMTHIDFMPGHPGVPTMLFGELQRRDEPLPKQVVQTLFHHYKEWLRRLLEAGKAQGELDVDAAAALFIGAIQGLVMQLLLAGDVAHIRRDAPGVFAIYHRGIGHTEVTQ